MLQADYNDFLTECANSALSAVEHHEKMMKYADEQIAYWQQYRQREQTAWNKAYVNYCDWLKKLGKKPERPRQAWKKIVIVNEDTPVYHGLSKKQLMALHYDAPLQETDEMLAQVAYESVQEERPNESSNNRQ